MCGREPGSRRRHPGGLTGRWVGPTWAAARAAAGAQRTSVGRYVSQPQGLLAAALLPRGAVGVAPPCPGAPPWRAQVPALHTLPHRSSVSPRHRADDHHKGPALCLELAFLPRDSANRCVTVRCPGKGYKAQRGRATAHSHRAPRGRAGTQAQGDSSQPVTRRPSQPSVWTLHEHPAGPSMTAIWGQAMGPGAPERLMRHSEVTKGAGRPPRRSRAWSTVRSGGPGAGPQEGGLHPRDRQGPMRSP